MKCDVAVLIMCMLCLSGGTCTGINTITHTNTAAAESAGWSQSTLPGAPSGVVQIQSTFSAVLGEGNTVSQSNTAGAYGSGALQIQDNTAIVEGNRNSIAQDNVALVIGDTETDYKKLVQKNVVLILGSDNMAVQSNTASVSTYPDTAVQSNTESNALATMTTESELAVPSSTTAGELASGASCSPEQVQVNVGFILGDRNWLYQSNRATFFRHRHIMSSPFFWKRQSNSAITVNNGQPAVMEGGV